MSALSQRLTESQERLQDTLADMRPRDRNLLLGLCLVALLGVVFGGIWWMRSNVTALESKVAEREHTLHQIKVMASEHAASEARLDELSAQLATYKDIDVSSYLEKAAQKVQIREKLESVRKKSETTDGPLIESTYSVKLSRLEQRELANFLAEIEGTDFPARIRTFKVRSRARKEGLVLDIDMDLASYQLVDDGTTGEEG